MAAMKYTCLLLCLLLFSAVGSSQQPQTPSDQDIGRSGNQFMATCESSRASDSLMHGLCRGYVLGLSDGMQMMTPALMCPAEHVTQGQFYRIAVKYLRDHPEKTDKYTSNLMFEAWTAAFPCPVKQ
jgi:hypothetical protein